MVNPVRGEISAKLDGKTYTLCLTLGALASLEENLSAGSLADLVEKFSSGKIRSSDLISIIAAGLVGAGTDVTEEQVADMHVESGVNGYVDIAARLLEAAFSPAPESNA